MTSPNLSITHHRVDDLPLILGLLQQMHVPQIVDQTIGNHAAHQGLSSGWLVTIWLAFIITEGDHAKSHVAEWVNRHLAVLQARTGQPVTVGDFNDTRLGRLVQRLSAPARWEACEADLWADHVSVYELDTPVVAGLRSQMIDTTTASGYHTVQADGVMQHGYSKDHRPDLPQLKLLTVSLHPHGVMVASEVVSGEQADDPLYLGVIARARAITGRTGVLNVGDCKMAALLTRGGIVAAEDLYLTPAALVGAMAQALPAWIEAALADPAHLQPIVNDAGEAVGQGYEVTRACEVTGPFGPRGGDRLVAWQERVLVVQSGAMQAQQAARLDTRLTRATAQLQALNQPGGRGRKRLNTQAAWDAAVQAILTAQDVVGLLTVTPHLEETRTERLVGPGRRGAQRATQEVVTQRFTVATTTRNAAAIQAAAARLGWRVLLTNAPAALTLPACVLHYRANAIGERNYHLLKAEPLGISPLFVHTDEQIVGLTHLLTLGVRVFTLFELQVQRGLAVEGVKMAGLYQANPKQATATPTAVAMLRAIARMELTVTVLLGPATPIVQLTPLPPLLEQILRYAQLPATLYTDLATQILVNTS